MWSGAADDRIAIIAATVETGMLLEFSCIRALACSSMPTTTFQGQACLMARAERYSLLAGADHTKAHVEVVPETSSHHVSDVTRLSGTLMAVLHNQ
jgi:hypothetical protein